MRFLIFVIAIISLTFCQGFAQPPPYTYPRLDCENEPNYDKGCGFCNSSLNVFSQCGGYERGYCNDENYCECTSDYYGAHCEGKRKSKLVAFLLTLLVGPIFGIPPCAGRFYLGYTNIAIGQLILGLSFWILFIPTCMAGFCSQITGGVIKAADQDGEAGIALCCAPAACFAGLASLASSVLNFFITLAILGWWLSDWIRILTGDLKDSNGRELAPF